MPDLQSRWETTQVKLEKLTSGHKGPSGIGMAAFLESSFLPFPFEALFVPALIINRKRALTFAHAALLGCLLASCLFYFIGMAFYDNGGESLMQWLGLQKEIESLSSELEQGLFWPIFLMSLLPFPLQAATLGSGALDVAFLPFILAILFSRMIRFHGLAVLVILFGDAIEQKLAIVSGKTKIILAVLTVILLLFLVLI